MNRMIKSMYVRRTIYNSKINVTDYFSC